MAANTACQDDRLRRPETDFSMAASIRAAGNSPARTRAARKLKNGIYCAP